MDSLTSYQRTLAIRCHAQLVAFTLITHSSRGRCRLLNRLMWRTRCKDKGSPMITPIASMIYFDGSRTSYAVEGRDVIRAQAEPEHDSASTRTTLVVLLCPSKLSSIGRRDQVRKWFRRFSKPVHVTTQHGADIFYELRGGRGAVRFLFQLLFVMGNGEVLNAPSASTKLDRSQCAFDQHPLSAADLDKIKYENGIGYLFSICEGNDCCKFQQKHSRIY